MRCLERNKTTFYYCLYEGKTPVADNEGNETGEVQITYSAPISLKANVSPAAGQTSIEQFGTSLQYDKVIVIDDPDCAIDETTVLFVDKEPEFDAFGDPLFDYTVKKVARSINSVSVAVQRVEVS